jgi:hypothetical protein
MAIVTAERALAAAGAQPVEVIPPEAQAATMNSYALRKALIGIGAIVVVVGADLVINGFIHDESYGNPGVPTPVQGLTIFATFFVTATAIERLLEPLSGLLPSASDAKTNAKNALTLAGAKVVNAAGKVDGTPESTAAKDGLAAAATSVDNSDYRTYWKSVSLWGTATVIAMFASAGLKLYFLRTVGIASGPRWVETLATGLIIGAGTKPLHDLVTYIQAAAAAKSS